MNSDIQKPMPAIILLVPGRPGTARVEYITHKDEVEDMLAKGYSARMIHEHLQERYAISCGYSAFCDYVRGRGKRKHSWKQNPMQKYTTR